SAEEKRKDPQPYLRLNGTDSHIRKHECLLIRSESEWIKTCQRHKGVKEAPEYDSFYNPLMLPAVDLERCMIVADCQVITWNNAGFHADSLVEQKDLVVLRFENKHYQTAEAAPAKRST